MGSVGVSELEHRLDSVLTYLEPYWDLVNCHMVNYLTDQHWEHFVPKAARTELCSPDDVNEVIETLLWRGERKSEKFPAFAEFILAGEHHRLDGCKELLTTVEHLEKQLAASTHSHLSIKEFMSAKKCHEVCIHIK